MFEDDITNQEQTAASINLTTPINAISEVRYRVMEDEIPIDRIRWCSDPERLAILLRENPALTCVRSGGGIYLFFEQFSMLKPELHNRLQPAFTLFGVGSMAIGFGLSALSISFTKADNFFARRNWDRKRAANILEHVNRIWMASIEGIGAIFPSVLTEIIILYCSDPDHWNGQGQCMVSDEDFSTKFLPGPLMAAIVHIAWHSIPFERKKAWSKINKCTLITTYAIDISLNALLYSRYIQAFIQNLGLIIEQASLVTKITESPNLAISEVPAISGSFTALALQILKPRYKQSITTLMTYFYGTVLLLRLTSDIYIEYARGKEPDGSSSLPWAIIKTIGFGIGIAGGALLTTLWSRTFVKEWIKIKQYVPIDSAHLLQKQIHDEVRKEIRQKIIDELQEQEEAIFLGNNRLSNDEQLQQNHEEISRDMPQVSEEISFTHSLTQLERGYISPNRSFSETEQKKAIVPTYRTQQADHRSLLSQTETSESQEKPKASLSFGRLKFNCGIM